MIYERFEQTVAQHPAAIAIVDGDRSMTFPDVRAEVEKTCAQLQAKGIGPGSAVLVLLPNGAEFAIAVLAVFRLGAICVPVNVAFPVDEIRYYLETSDAKAILHSGLGHVDALGEADRFAVIDIRQREAVHAETQHAMMSAPPIAVDSTATYTYSSGSTGKPKRVTRSHGQWVAEFDALASTIGLAPGERILCAVPLFHTHGFGNCLMAAMLSGGTLVLTSGEFSPRNAVRAIERHRITIFPAVPFMAKMIADTSFKTPPDFSSLRLWFTAGAALPKEVAARAREKFGLRPCQLYGSTETGAMSINLSSTPGSDESVGLPLRGVEIDIIDENGSPLPNGEIGEVAVRSAAMTQQYDGMPEATSEHFVGGRFLTGDLGCKNADGQIFIKGRKKLLINVAGNKVDPLDVEAIIRTHPKVRDVVVLGKPHEVYGEMVKAVVVGEPDCSSEEIIAVCAKHLAEYKIPRVVEFRAEIPKSPLGKILRKYL